MLRPILPRKLAFQSVLPSLVGGVTFAGTANAQSTYPNKPIRLIIAFVAGAAVDTISRILGTGLGSLGKTITMGNKPGAAGILGTGFVAKAVPDGYTLLSGATRLSRWYRTSRRSFPTIR